MSLRAILGSALFLISFGAARADTPIVSIRIGSDSIPWARFIVDGQYFQGESVFLWPQGSKHVVQVLSDVASQVSCASNLSIQLSGAADIAIVFGGWKDNNGLLNPTSDPVQTITADPNVTSLIASFDVEYRVALNFFQGQPLGNPQFCIAANPGAPWEISPGQLHSGVAYIDNAAFWANAILYLKSGKHVLNAFPAPGFTFDGWSVNGSAPSPYLTTVDVEGPVTLTPYFRVAKRVRFMTSPMGLNILVDHTSVPTAPYLNTNLVQSCPSEFTRPPAPPPGVAPLCYGDFDFAPGSRHVIGAPSPQMDTKGKGWVFDSWSGGGGQNTTYVVDNNTAAMDIVTAKFVRGAVVGFYTIPNGLQLTIDGRGNWPYPALFTWALGSTHSVSAPATQADSKGRKYTFKGWSNGGAADQKITVDQSDIDKGNFRMTASYDVLSRLVVQTSPPGLTIQVDGSSCQTPCTVDKPNGSSVRVTAPSSIAVNDSSRLDFVAWSDNGAASHAVILNSDMQTLTANYQTMYYLSASSNPSGGASFQFSPNAPDMFYPAGQPVTVSAQANPGFKFRRWGGDLSGTYPSGQVTMTQPCNVIAQLDTVPYIAPAGIQNAAGPTPDQVVAPGSIISVYGASLTNDTVTGPASPLSQSLGGVVVTVADRILPLLFVSPNQVNAQLPSDLPEGDYTLTVSTANPPNMTGTFTAARNAPGLFAASADARPIALALHEDGTQITSANPAKRGETITVYGTGFGPCQQSTIAGFLPPAGLPNPLVDNLTVQLGDFQPRTIFAGAAPDRIGIEIVRFQITPDLPATSTLELKVTVNNRASNTVLLPLE